MDLINMLLIICGGGIFLMLIIILIVMLAKRSSETDTDEIEDIIKEEISAQNAQTKQEITEMINMLGTNQNQSIEQLGNYLGRNQGLVADAQSKQLSTITETQSAFIGNVNERMSAMTTSVNEQLGLIQTRMDNLEKSNRDSMREMRAENEKKLDEIRGTVEEKLQSTLEKRIAESFRTVNEQLEQVYRGLGEMQAIAGDVGSLKKVLSGVKTRGILGEIQLGAILEEILTPEQYDTNAAVVPGGTQRVEYAVKLPAADGTVYLPIDAKFPGDTYQQLLDAKETADASAVENAYRNLETVIKKEAKDIRDKYIAVPYTTNFAIMFLPFEGLYAEVVNRGMVEVLQREYSVNIAGPSTMAALLNSLQMGFKTLAIQKRSNEVWQVLGEVKTEFGKFEDGLKKMQNHLNQTSSDLDNLIGTRTRAINRKLSNIQAVELTGDGGSDTALFDVFETDN